MNVNNYKHFGSRAFFSMVNHKCFGSRAFFSMVVPYWRRF